MSGKMASCIFCKIIKGWFNFGYNSHLIPVQWAYNHV